MNPIASILYALAAAAAAGTVIALVLARRRRRRRAPGPGVITVRAGAPIRAGQMVVIGADGRARPAASSSPIAGIALAPPEDDGVN